MTRLDGWATSERWLLLHYVRDGLPLCGRPTVVRLVRLVGSVEGRLQCLACVQLTTAVPR